MDAQTIINILIGICGCLMGWVLRNVTNSIEGLQDRDSVLSDKVQHMEVLVAGTYVKRDDLEKNLDKISLVLYQKLDRIEAKVDQKADK